jgi:hypothetical protein
VVVADNEFRVTPERVGCVDLLCARQALLSNFGSVEGSPYKGRVIQDAITFDQGNVWRENRYVGPWRFVVHDMSTEVDFDEWRAEPYGQDSGSSLR